MHVHILGICGTFMGGIAAIATELGHKVTGSDTNVYPPMSTQLEQLGIALSNANDLQQFDDTPDVVVIGNALSRGHPAVEYVLDRNLPYTSGPQWLLENLLKDRWVLAVSGTHGKTSTASMLAWILESAGLNPGFLIGGVPENFNISARKGESPFFVIEADEYDSAFFDKRSKFVHYRPRTLILNNLEFDHADIFDSLADIQKQFHHLIRTVPSNGLLLVPAIDGTTEFNNDISVDKNFAEVLEKGVWSEIQSVGSSAHSMFQTSKITPDASVFDLTFPDTMNNSASNQVLSSQKVRVEWPLIGDHNMYNAAMAIAAARHVGVKIDDAVDALAHFKNVKRRMEIKGVVNNITIYDDFAHHPTAIQTTLDGLRKKVGNDKIIAIIELRSNTMRMGFHQSNLAHCWQQADHVIILNNNLSFSLDTIIATSETNVITKDSVDEIVTCVGNIAKEGDNILVMSNGNFGGIHQKLLDELQ